MLINITLIIALIFLVFDVVLLFYLLIQEIFLSSSVVTFGELSPFAIFAGVLVALISFLISERRKESEVYLNNAISLTEKAYEVLSVLGDDGFPKNERIRWLDAARLVKTSENVGKLIKVQSHKSVYMDNRRYWKSKFRDLIFPKLECKEEDGFPEDYYAESVEKFITWRDGDREPLSGKSLAVLYRFIRWEKENYPLSEECDFTDEEIKSMKLYGPRNLAKLLEKTNNYVF